MVPRENKNNAYAKFGGTDKEYYGIFRSGLFLITYCGELFQIIKYGGHNSNNNNYY